ncbi:MAG: MgtC/SapB family protein [Desulfovibrionaceae bacterium]|nr:MgtC/SapB family protein [Desulfovibrionaceae bacterium]
MDIDMALQLEYLGRLCLAGVCGLFVGYERINRGKEAGVRTHFIVALASALMMEISKYGFYDMLSLEGVAALRFDPARVAAQIVTGIGFLGAGIIFVRNQTISGLTTAAGVWGTAGVGMAIGAGMYVVGIAGTVLIVVAQVLLHKNFPFLHVQASEHLRLEVERDGDGLKHVTDTLIQHNVTVLAVRAEESGGSVVISMTLRLPRDYSMVRLLELMAGHPCVRALDV